MILVDSSVWIEFLGSKTGKFGRELERLIVSEEDLAIADLVAMEVLQGIRDDSMYVQVKQILFDFPVYQAGGLAACLKSCEIYRLCRKNGFTIRKSIDCLLAVVAIENDLVIFHKDRDFDLIARVSPLKVYKI